MKVFFDHNLSPNLARALQALFIDEHEVVALRDKFKPSITDEEWIAALSRDGAWVVISGDLRITKIRAEREAFRRSRLIGFFLQPSLKKAPVTKQAERLLALWSSIETVASLVQGGAMYELPMRSLKIRQLRP